LHFSARMSNENEAERLATPHSHLVATKHNVVLWGYVLQCTGTIEKKNCTRRQIINPLVPEFPFKF